MLDLLVVQQVKLLLGSPDPISRRKIAKLVKISRGSVSAIANGTWCGFHRSQPGRLVGPRPRGRCSTCGGRDVELPCRLCEVRRVLTGLGMEVRRRIATECEGVLELRLQPEHQASYERIRVREGETIADRVKRLMQFDPALAKILRCRDSELDRSLRDVEPVDPLWADADELEEMA